MANWLLNAYDFELSIIICVGFMMKQAVKKSKVINMGFFKNVDDLTKDPFAERFRGYFVGMTKWHHLDQLWLNVNTQMDDAWFIYAVGEAAPDVTTSRTEALKFITEINNLLRKEHKEDYCGIVYVDNVDTPAFIKIFDPNNLGVSCGFSDYPPLPGWIMSKMPPCDLNLAFPPPKSRRRWWKNIFS